MGFVSGFLRRLRRVAPSQLPEGAQVAPAAAIDQEDPAFLLSDPSLLPWLAEIDSRLPAVPPKHYPALLSNVSLQLFSLIALARPASLPHLSAWLPAMPPDAHQFNSTSFSGRRAMSEAAAFVRSIVERFEARGGVLRDAKVLDYGVCWARHSRLFYKYVPTDQLFGVDAWIANLNLARQCGYLGQLGLIGDAPSSLPFEDKFDLVFSFSVFTHLSEDVARSAIRAIRGSMNAGGLLAITVRPHAFWRLVDEPRQQAYKAALDRSGYAFAADAWTTAEGGPPGYGNANYSLAFIEEHWPEFRVLGTDFSASEPYQLYVFLEAV